MTAVTFIGADGAEMVMDAAPGERLLDTAQAAGQPLEGTCDGQMACSTCHVWLDGAGGPTSEEEDDLLDMTPHVRADSRLACQVRVAATPLVARIPHARR